MNNLENALKKCTQDFYCPLQDKKGICKGDYCTHQKINQIIKAKNELSLIEFIEAIERQRNRMLTTIEIFALLSTSDKEKMLSENIGNFLIDDKGLIFNLRTHKRIR